MPTWAWIVIAVAVVVVVALALLAVARRRRTARLQETFGPEYDRTVETAGTRRDAEAELSDRVRRRRKLEIRSLAPEARVRYAEEWREVQASFVDDPKGSLAAADGLVYTVMAERGYPMEDFEQRAADVSVDYPHVVDNYRAAHDIAGATSDGTATTEEMRRGMQHYRALFDELLEGGADEPLARDTDSADSDVPADREVTR
jgi:hypothetical protein